MPNKFYNLTKEHDLLMKKINQAPPLSKIQSKDFFKYHSLISKKEILEHQIYQLSHARDLIVNTYSTNNEKWLYDDSMNCRQYCKLEQRASYVRDKKLFKLGFLDTKPTHPIKQNIQTCINQKIVEPYSETFNSKISNIKNKFKSLLKKTPLTQINNYLKSNIIKEEIKKEANIQPAPFLSRIRVNIPSSPTQSNRYRTHDIQDQYDIAL